LLRPLSRPMTGNVSRMKQETTDSINSDLTSDPRTMKLKRSPCFAFLFLA
jgi:hypothetical protein